MPGVTEVIGVAPAGERRTGRRLHRDDARALAAAKALADLAREPVPAEVLEAYKLDKLSFGRDYIIPKPFDPRLIERIPPAVAAAAK